eukprot:SAG31_NODE_5106_length_2740_cov_6.966538_4_plen_27_part_01
MRAGLSLVDEFAELASEIRLRRAGEAG